MPAWQPRTTTGSAGWAAVRVFPLWRLLNVDSGVVAVTFSVLKGDQLGERVVVLVFGDFGRRVAETATGGTDHGVAGPVFLVGDAVKGVFIGKHPAHVT